MKRLFVAAGVIALGVLALGGARAEDDKEADTIKKIMQKSFGGKANFKTRTQKAIKDKDWDEADKEAKAWLKHAKKLPDLKPPVGDADGFKKAANTLVKTLTTLEKGISDKNANVANGAVGKINSSCAGCHDNYRPKKNKK